MRALGLTPNTSAGAPGLWTMTTTAGWIFFRSHGHVYPEIEKLLAGVNFKNPRIVYRNLGNGKFKDVSAEMGPGSE